MSLFRLGQSQDLRPMDYVDDPDFRLQDFINHTVINVGNFPNFPEIQSWNDVAAFWK